LEMLRWDLIPSWADDPSIGARMINAHSDTVAEKPSFRHAFKGRRSLIPADGFYEWQKTNDGKQPYYIRMKSGRPSRESEELLPLLALYSAIDMQAYPVSRRVNRLSSNCPGRIEPAA
jgi:putative SOS response-associated peptidase YedK